MPFEKAYSEKKKREQHENIEYLNVGAWLNGLYVTRSIAACFSNNDKYPENPIDIFSDKSEKTLDEHAANFMEYAVAFNLQRKKKLEESGEDKDGN